MNRIIRQGYPVSKLPEDLRRALPGQSEVRVTIDWDDDASPALDQSSPDRVKTLEELYAIAQPSFASLDEVAAHVRASRDEWN